MRSRRWPTATPSTPRNHPMIHVRSKSTASASGTRPANTTMTATGTLGKDVRSVSDRPGRTWATSGRIAALTAMTPPTDMTHEKATTRHRAAASAESMAAAMAAAVR